MYFDFANTSLINCDRTLLKELNNNAYRIYFKYDELSNDIFCVAVKNISNNFFSDLSETDVAYFSITPFSGIKNRSTYERAEALLRYILSKYNKLNSQEKVKFYKDINENILYVEGDNLEARQIYEKRNKFIEFLNNLPKETSSNEENKHSYKIRLNLMIRSSPIGNGLRFLVRFDIVDNITNKVVARNLEYQKLSEKISAKYTNEKKNIYLAEENFDEVSKKIIHLANSFTINNSDSYYYNELNIEQLASLFDFCIANEISFFKTDVAWSTYEYGAVIYKPAIIDFERLENGYYEIDDEGQLIFHPDFDVTDTKRVYASGNVVFIIENKENSTYKMSYFNFSNKFTRNLFIFNIENPNYPFNLVKDLVKNNLAPRVKNQAKVSPRLLSKLFNVNLKFKYFAELTRDNNLLVKTKYYLKDEEVSKIDIFENEDYQKYLLEAENTLKNHSLIEEGKIEDENVIIDFLTDDISDIKNYYEVYLSDELTRIKNRKKIKFNLTSVLKQDWLALKLHSDELNDEQIKEVLAKYKRKKRFIRLKDNSIVTLDDEDVSLLNSLSDDFSIDNDEIEVPLYEIFKVNSYKDSLSISMDEKIKNILNEVKEFRTAGFLPVLRYKNILRNYQIEAFKWMSILRKYNLSGILADDMGLGKTLEMISFISSLKEEEPILIISPKSLIFNREHEFKMWDDSIKTYVVSGSKEDRLEILKNLKNKEKAVFITTYDSLRNDLDIYSQVSYNLLVLDEAQYIKNSHAQKTIATKHLVAKTKFVLTGTPIENSLADLWSIFDFLMPGYLYNYSHFKEEFENAILDKDELTEKRLQGRIAPFILRRVKKDVLKDLPPKIETSYVVKMNEKQSELYDSYLLDAKKTFEDEDNDKNKFLILRALTRLRQICLDPSMFLENYDDVSEKLEAAISLIKDAINDGHKVLIFSSFTKSLEHLLEMLKEEEIKTYYIYGQTKASDRLKMCEEFNTKDDTKVFLISLKAGGTGLNLIGADIIIHLDPWWNVAAENQASDRAHRIGQTRTVNVIKMICKDTIEEKVIKLQEAKKDLMDKFIGEGEKGVVSLSDEDIKFLLS